jgi:hypothetical protein
MISLQPCSNSEEAAMTDVKWAIKAREFTNCNCSYGCPCQFNGLPTHGDCRAVVGMEIDEGYHGEVRLDGLKFAGIFSWPGAIHEGRGEAAVIVDERASEAQRNALLRILSGQDTEPGATIFNVFASTLEKTHKPIFSRIDFEVDVDARRAHLTVPGMIETRGEPILNPVTARAPCASTWWTASNTGWRKSGAAGRRRRNRSCAS